MSGRPPLPTSLKLLKGETRPSRINDREPKPKLGDEAPAEAESNRCTVALAKPPERRSDGVYAEVDPSPIGVASDVRIALAALPPPQSSSP